MGAGTCRLSWPRSRVRKAVKVLLQVERWTLLRQHGDQWLYQRVQAIQCLSTLSYQVTLISHVTMHSQEQSSPGNSSGVVRGSAPTRSLGPLCPGDRVR